MFICSGWICLGLTEQQEEDESARLAELDALLRAWPRAPRGRSANSINFAHFVHLWDCRNHPGQSEADVTEFVTAVCALFSNSFGAIHFVDEANAARVLTIQSGRPAP